MIYQQTIQGLFKLQPLNMLDEWFLMDYKENLSNIITVVKLDKMNDYESFRNYVIQRTTIYPRTRHYLFKFLGEYFFKEMTQTQLKEAIKTRYIKVDKINTDDDIANFVAK